MPLMMCPNCQTEMKEINRQGVQIDMCAQCHGVWLDRGELNKLLELNKQEMAEDYAPATQPQPQAQRAPQQQYDDRQYHQPHGGQHHHYKKRSKLESLFEMFD